MLLASSHLFASNKWEFITTIEGIPQALEVLDSNNLYISSTEGAPNWLYRSSDQGKSWKMVFNDFNHVEYNNDLSVPDSNHILLIFNGGIMFKTEDGGKNFVRIQLDSVNSFNYIKMRDSNIGVLSDAYISNIDTSYIFITFDGWKTYQKFRVDEKISRHSPCRFPQFLNDSILFIIVYDSKVSPFDTYLLKLNLKTEEYEFNFIDKIYTGLFDLCVVNKDLLFICGISNVISGGSGRDALYKSTNGGKTWRRVLDLYYDNRFDDHSRIPFGLQSIAFRDSLSGIAVGQFGKIVYTYDGGESWIYEDSLQQDISKKTPATMIIRYAGSLPIVATISGNIYHLAEDNMAPAPDDIYSISGRVWEGEHGQAGIPISCGYRVTMTDSAGYYRFTRLAKGKTYKVKAMNKYFDGPNHDMGYKPFAYHPDDYVIDLTHDTTGFDFNAEDLRVFHSVSGRIAGSGDSGMANITLQIDDSTAITDATGNYFFPKIEQGNRTVTPIDTNFLFTPKSYSINLQNDTTLLNFSAVPVTGIIDLPGNRGINILYANGRLITDHEIPISGITLIVSDVLGREVLTAPLTEEITLPDLMPGIYFVSLIKKAYIYSTYKIFVGK